MGRKPATTGRKSDSQKELPFAPRAKLGRGPDGACRRSDVKRAQQEHNGGRSLPMRKSASR